MTKKIFEEAPKRIVSGSVPNTMPDKIRKQARQLAYDVRYKVKSRIAKGEQKPDAASLKRAYVQELEKSSAVGPVKALAKKMLIGEQYDFVNVSDLAEQSTLKAYNKVFVEGVRLVEKKDSILEERTERKLIRITNVDGRTQIRRASDEQIAKLRKNPKIRSLEIIDERRQPESMDRTGQQVSDKPVRKESLDPVGKEDGDVDNDGDEDESDSYLLKRRKAIGKSIEKRKKGKKVSEEFIGEVKTQSPQNGGVLDVMPQGKKHQNQLIINPPLGESKKTQCPKCGGKGCNHCGGSGYHMSEEHGDRDRRADRAYREMLKNKLRSGLGVKNPMIVSDPEKLEKDFDKVATAASVKDSMGGC